MMSVSSDITKWENAESLILVKEMKGSKFTIRFTSTKNEHPNCEVKNCKKNKRAGTQDGKRKFA